MKKEKLRGQDLSGRGDEQKWGSGGDGCFESPDNHQVWFQKRSECSWLTAQLSTLPPHRFQALENTTSTRSLTWEHMWARCYVAQRRDICGGAQLQTQPDDSLLTWHWGSKVWLPFVFKPGSFIENKVKWDDKDVLYSLNIQIGTALETVPVHAWAALGMITDRL